jgi:hypothetical protein
MKAVGSRKAEYGIIILLDETKYIINYTRYVRVL